MGLDDWEDVVPGIFVAIAVLGLVGMISSSFTVIKTVPILGPVALGIHNLVFMAVAGLFKSYIPIATSIVAVIIELITIVGGIIFIVKVKVL